MKKKIFVLALIVALVAVLVTTGSLAWFTAEDEATNVFTIGAVDIEQIEQQRDENGALEDFDDFKQLLPVVPDAAGTQTATDDLNFQDKIVTVKNVGKNDCYLQTFIAVPAVLTEADVLNLQYSNSQKWVGSATPIATVKETVIDAGGDADMDYYIYKFTYTEKLAAGATTDRLLEGVYVNKDADMEILTKDAAGNVTEAEFVMNGSRVQGFNIAEELNVYVATQAIQESGFADPASALAAFALHPWA